MKKGWEIVKLGKVLKSSENSIAVVPTGSYKLLGLSLEGRGLFVREEKLGSEVSAKYLNKVVPGEFMYSRLFAWKGAFDKAANDFEGCYVSDEFPAFKPDKDKLDIDYLAYFFKQKSVWAAVEQYCMGVTKASRNRFKEQFFLNFEIPLPPLSEQQRIAGRLAALKGKIDAVRVLRGEQVREVERMTFDVLDSFFVEGEEKTIGQVCEKPQYGYTASADFQNGNARFVRITDIQNGQVQWQSVPYCQCENPTNYILKEDDILFARTGGTIGKSFLVKSVPEASVFASYLIRLRVKEKVLPEYLYLFFQSKSYWQQITNSKSGTGQPNLNGSKLAEIVLKVPAISEQRRIVSEIKVFQSKMDALRVAQAGQLAALEGLFPGVLERAFRGEW